MSCLIRAVLDPHLHISPRSQARIKTMWCPWALYLNQPNPNTCSPPAKNIRHKQGDFSNVIYELIFRLHTCRHIMSEQYIKMSKFKCLSIQVFLSFWSPHVGEYLSIFVLLALIPLRCRIRTP